MEYLANSGDRTTAKLLIVDDEPGIRSPLMHALSHAGYTVEEAGSGRQALALLQSNRYHLMVLDLWMPGVSGLDVMRQARQLCPDLLIIILTGNATVESAIAGVKSEEVVDYLCKPVKNRELIEAVANALEKNSERLRHRQLFEAVNQILDVPPESETPPKSNRLTSPPDSDKETVFVPPLILNRKKRIVTVENNPPRSVELTKGETAVLTSLMLGAGQVLSCEELVSTAWGYDADKFEAQSIIRPHIRRLRQKLETNPKKPCLICTVRRHGYQSGIHGWVALP